MITPYNGALHTESELADHLENGSKPWVKSHFDLMFIDLD